MLTIYHHCHYHILIYISIDMVISVITMLILSIVNLLTISTTRKRPIPQRSGGAPIDLGQTSDGGGRGFHTSDGCHSWREFDRGKNIGKP